MFTLRPSGRAPDQLREVHLELGYTKHAEGSVLISYGDTKVLCNASIKAGTPLFVEKNHGWLTAEYSMLPRATLQRSDREAVRGKQNGRTMEIQRLIGRALRAAVDLSLLGEYTITVDCDVLQADGGTRTASITGACLAVAQAIRHLQQQKKITTKPFIQWVAAVSVGIYAKLPVLDLDYAEDSKADTDMNVIMNQNEGFIEVQGTAENACFSATELNSMLALAQDGVKQLITLQKEAFIAGA